MGKSNFQKGVKQGRDEFLKQYNDLLVDPGTISKSNGVISTGSIKVDALLGGGLRKGVLSMFWGSPQAGKSALALSTARSVLKDGGSVLWYDFERGLDTGWLLTNGIDPMADKFDIGRPVYGEDLFDMLEQAVKGDAYDLIVVDSFASVPTRRELDNDVGSASFGSVAALSSNALKRLMAAYGMFNNTNTHIIVVNQVRDRVNSPVGGQKPYGGNALPHYVGYSLRLRKIGESANDKTGEVVTRAKVQVTKSRYAPRRSTEVQISSKWGVDVVAEILEYAIEAGYVEKKGAWFTFYDPEDLKLEVGKEQGESAAKQFLLAQGWVERLYEEAVAGFEVTEPEQAA